MRSVGRFGKQSSQRIAVLLIGALVILILNYTVLDGLSGGEESQQAAVFKPAVRVDEDIENSESSFKHAFVYLVEQRKLDLLNYSLHALYENFNAQHRYPVLIFFAQSEFTSTSRFSSPGEEFEIIKEMLPEPFCSDLHMMITPWVLPDGETEESIGSFWPTGYKHMIRFWFKNIFEHPVIRKLEYYIRLDVDSNICSPIVKDPFKHAKANSLKYGYRNMDHDTVTVTKGLWQFVYEYQQSHQDVISAEFLRKNDYAFPETKELRDTADTLTYYNNFEMAHVPTFINEPIWSFVEAVDKSLGIYLHRWGDAPLRWHQIHMFLDVSSEVYHFEDFEYVHSQNLEHTIRSCPLKGFY